MGSSEDSEDASNISKGDDTTTYQEPAYSSSIIVLHPGSFYLRLGLGSSFTPYCIPHVIARKRSLQTSTKFEERLFPRIYTSSELKMRTAQQGYKKIRQELSQLLSRHQKLVNTEEISETNGRTKGAASHLTSDLHWTSTAAAPDYLIGEDALYVKPNSGYNVHFPYRRGQLNIHSGPVGGTLTSALADIEVIWRDAIEQLLNISRDELCNYKVMLVIPDVYNRSHVRELVNVLICRLSFSAVLLQQESVCAAFGSGVSSACVVDCGDQKLAVSCVEDGLVDTNTSVTYDYGGADISSCLFWLLHNSNFPYKKCNMNSRLDCMLIHSIKETYCHLEPAHCGKHSQTFEVRTPDTKVVTYCVCLGDEPIIAPMSMFMPDILGISGSKFVHVYAESVGECDDIFDDNYLRESSRRAQEVAITGTAGGKPGKAAADYDDDVGFDAGEPLPAARRKISSEKRINPDVVLGVDKAILKSIDACGSEESKERMFACILLVGGGLSFFHNVQQWLQKRLREQMPMLQQHMSVDVFTRAKELDPREVGWKGAAILSCLDTAQELWVGRDEWELVGTRALRDKMPFNW